MGTNQDSRQATLRTAIDVQSKGQQVAAEQSDASKGDYSGKEGHVSKAMKTPRSSSPDAQEVNGASVKEDRFESTAAVVSTDEGGGNNRTSVGFNGSNMIKERDKYLIQFDYPLTLFLSFAIVCAIEEHIHHASFPTVYV